MSNKIVYFTLLLFIVFLVSCSKETRNTTSVYFAKKTDMAMSDLVSDYTFISLETKDDNLILDASMVRIWNDYIYILDCFSQNKSIYVFDIQGKYFGKIGNVGGGPGEYIMPLAIVVDEVNNQLIVKDVALNKLLYYNLSSFKYVKEQSIPFYSDCMEYYKDETIVWYIGSGCANVDDYQKHIQVSDLQCNIIDRYIPRKKFPQRSMYNVMTYFHKYNDKLFFHHPFSNVVYSYNNVEDSVMVEYTLSSDGIIFPSEEYVMDNNENIVEQLSNDGHVQYYDLHENSEKILCYFGVNKSKYIGVYSKKDGIGLYSDVEHIKDDMGLIKYGRPKTVYNDFFVNVIYREGLDSLSENSVLKPYFESKDNNLNPILVLYK